MNQPPNAKQLERMLATLTVSATVRRCHPQFWAMDEIMRRVLSRPEDSIFSVELISVAARAFLDDESPPQLCGQWPSSTARNSTNGYGSIRQSPSP
jgi:hypothetical protein